MQFRHHEAAQAYLDCKRALEAPSAEGVATAKRYWLQQQLQANHTAEVVPVSFGGCSRLALVVLVGGRRDNSSYGDLLLIVGCVAIITRWGQNLRRTRGRCCLIAVHACDGTNRRR